MSAPTVIVTGASRGLGRATALILAQMGANLALNARSAQALAQVRAEIEELGARVQVLPGDISAPDVVERLVATAILHFGGIDVVINNAAILEPLAQIDDSDPMLWRRNLDINVWAPYLLVQAALPYLRRSLHGRVINVSSGAAVRPTIGWSAYCVSKAAINMFTSVLAMEEPEITSIAFRPGAVDTSMQSILRQQGKGVMTEEVHHYFAQLHARHELLSPELPGRALAALGLYAPNEWSGRFIRWNEPTVQQLVEDVDRLGEGGDARR